MEFMTSKRTAHEISTSRSFCSLEIEYGRAHHGYLAKWNWWRDKCFERVNGLHNFELKYDLQIDYEQMPKYA